MGCLVHVHADVVELGLERLRIARQRHRNVHQRAMHEGLAGEITPPPVYRDVPRPTLVDSPSLLPFLRCEHDFLAYAAPAVVTPAHKETPPRGSWNGSFHKPRQRSGGVALISAKYYNPDSDVALVTNFGRWNIPEEFLSIFDKWEIKVMEIPFDQFRFQGSYTWALAFYKLCVLKKLSCMKYESICYMDTDVYIQGSFDAIWTECRQNIMLYDINHGLNTRDYVLLCDEIESYCGQRKLITHYGGEFFAASALKDL